MKYHEILTTGCVVGLCAVRPLKSCGMMLGVGIYAFVLGTYAKSLPQEQVHL